MNAFIIWLGTKKPFAKKREELKMSNKIRVRGGSQVTATDGDRDRPQNIVYFLTGQGIDPDNPTNSKFDINRTTGEIYVLKVCVVCVFLDILSSIL